MIPRLLNWQAITGLVASIGLAILLAIQALQTRHWKKQSATFEKLYLAEQNAFASTVADARAAADAAHAADRANSDRVTTEQRAITERTANDFEARVAAARADAERLRRDPPADPGVGGSASMSGIPATSRRPAEAAGHDRLPPPDALIATEQAIQLDELIKWVRAQAKVDNNPSAVASPTGDDRR